MKIFLDTASLIKLYHRETGTAELEKLFSAIKITAIYLSEITKTEFTSDLWKKVRTTEITAAQAQTTLKLFEADFPKYTFIATDSIIIEQARLSISKYGAQGLRTLDSIQLATAISLSQQADLFFTHDKLSKLLFIAEGLPTELTSN